MKNRTYMHLLKELHNFKPAEKLHIFTLMGNLMLLSCSEVKIVYADINQPIGELQ